MISIDQFADLTTRAIVADLVPQGIHEMRSATPAQAQAALNVAQRLLRSEQPELVAWGWRVAYSFGVVYARDMQAFLLALDRQRQA